jgi:hypothetical protein
MKLHTVVALLLTALLAACGGSSGSDTMPPPVAGNEVPASAYASTDAFASYVASLAPSDTAEPLDVSKVVPPTSETEEPKPL